LVVFFAAGLGLGRGFGLAFAAGFFASAVRLSGFPASVFTLRSGFAFASGFAAGRSALAGAGAAATRCTSVKRVWSPIE
jgi:hypothetical protein